MPINDSNNERRNLTVLSLSIIAFYVGEGELGQNGVLNLPLINISFHNGHFLGYLVWIVLFWFAFRYWIENKEDAKDKIFSELDGSAHGLKYFKKQLRQLFLIDDNERLQFVSYSYIKSPKFSEKQLSLKYINPQNSSGGFEENSIDLSRNTIVQLDLIFYVSVFLLFFSKPALSTYYAPFLLFSIAILLGIYSSLPCYMCLLF